MINGSIVCCVVKLLSISKDRIDGRQLANCNLSLALTGCGFAATGLVLANGVIGKQQASFCHIASV